MITETEKQSLNIEVLRGLFEKTNRELYCSLPDTPARRNALANPNIQCETIARRTRPRHKSPDLWHYANSSFPRLAFFVASMPQSCSYHSFIKKSGITNKPELNISNGINFVLDLFKRAAFRHIDKRTGG